MRYQILGISFLVSIACKPSAETQQKAKTQKASSLAGASQDSHVASNAAQQATQSPLGFSSEQSEAGSSTSTLPSAADASSPQTQETSALKPNSPPLLPTFCASLKKTGDWKSTKAFYGASGKLEYPMDGEKNRIPDFSYAGYHYGEVDPPNYPQVKTIGPIPGDNTASIQKALDELAAKKPDGKGIRGALLLAPGNYSILGTLNIKESGMVLRGSGDGNNPLKDTILLGEQDLPHQRTIVVVGTGAKSVFVPEGSPVAIKDEFVPVGSIEVTVESAGLFKIGDWVQVKHPSSQAWLDAIGGGGVIASARWALGSTDIVYNRRIVSIKDKTLRLDAPLYNHLNRKLAISTVSKLTVPPTVKESGVENLRIDIRTLGGEDENHAWNAVGFIGAEDSWARQLSLLHYGQAGVFTKQSIRITVDRVSTSEPVGIRTGERFYNFNAADMSQLILVKNCSAKDGRHNFISNGVQTSSGLVYYKCTIEGASDSEGHRRWTTGMLFDSITEKSGSKGGILLYNRADYGTSHGWGAAHSVVWNYNGFTTIQKPPTAQNYVVTEKGTTKASPHPGALGSIEIKSGSLVPASLYEAQLCERLQLQ